MSSIINNPGLAPLVHLAEPLLVAEQDDLDGEADAVEHHPQAPDNLAGHQVNVGNSGLGHLLSSVINEIKFGLANFFSIAPQAQVIEPNPAINQLLQPMVGSLTLNQGVMHQLQLHCDEIDCPLPPEAVRSFVAVGERLLSGIRQSAALDVGQPVQAHVDAGQNPMPVTSTQFTTRAIAWALMAKAAERNVNNPHLQSSTVANASFVLKDPDNKLFNFMSGAAVIYDRVSTHFEDRTPDGAPRTRMHKPVQKGMEDYENCLPGKKGALLFSHIDAAMSATNDDAEIFLKFESSGMPPLIGGGGFGRAFERNVQHSMSYLSSRGDHAQAGGVERKEHVHKDALKPLIWTPFNAMVGHLVKGGCLSKSQGEMMKFCGKHQGVGFIEFALTSIHAGRNPILDSANPAAGMQPLNLDHLTPAVREMVQNLVNHVQLQIHDLHVRSGDAIDPTGIGRRGAEVHLTI